MKVYNTALSAMCGALLLCYCNAKIEQVGEHHVIRSYGRSWNRIAVDCGHPDVACIQYSGQGSQRGRISQGQSCMMQIAKEPHL